VFHCKDGLELRDLIHRIDEVDTFDSVHIALMDAVHTQITRATIWKGFAPLTDVDLGRAGLVERSAFGQVSRMLAQVV
jgi:hypothetical protein